MLYYGYSPRPGSSQVSSTCEWHLIFFEMTHYRILVGSDLNTNPTPEQTSSAWVESFDKLLDAYEQIGETIPLLIQYEALFKNNPYMPRVLELIYYDILEFHRRALKFFKQRGLSSST